ncbi:hypothetical protein A2130_02365 [Candidatus Woesebacteria bacterium GWC2_33_12]|uniref:Glycosyltransferase RgtA/B/C/D-like domain-containing protein n=1 Tax=Candidatus Woesebacteria bacterium GW2011_GWB1_33_22 TaxID=1618566 RepID=A0A0G0C2P4_9BACT|nr:MAG: hypothetical protein UR29_C0006G0012 [Candidatus Woesebacteria bacterium GW2011_GWC2_33_12]KKP42801.1 MAG: hypothetical protein UR33_C0001G0162 [Candidatus Woesebacteria bacterium GW2011_GWA2_33_20]KKP45425.1 MAG: hypothetical protein UR35_C0001G0022 [Candidatus Woesebacteria bacterium GW2011_GWB1_33_22]KKP46266.1 MAG: hypothetical protein UR37_C0010G0022 [Microgenomates group bacterium GW2011_GWC1_33_28]KKP50375.1 MAG: hypothetical protein UR41_C0009G0022 [Candidatus Woesebacteria bact
MDFKETFHEWKWTGLGLLVILIIGFGIRIVNLTILPIFVDEAIYVRWAQVMAWEPTLRFLPLSDGKQPLFMWVLMFLIKYFQDPLFIGRLVSVCTGVGTILGIFVFSNLLFKNKLVSLISALIYSFSPFAVFFDRMALVDSMLSMFAIWTAIFGFLTAKYKRLDLAMMAGFTLGFAMLTKSPAIFIAFLLPSFWFLTNLKGIWRLGITYFIAFVMYNIQRLGPNFELLTSRTGDYILPISHIWTNFKDPLLPHLKDFLVWMWSMGPLALIPLILIGTYIGFKKYSKETLLLCIWSFLPVFVQSEYAKAYTARYIFFTLPYFFILSSLTILAWQKTVAKCFLAFIFLAFIFSSLRFDYTLLTNPEKANLPRGERSGYLEEWTAGQGIKEISNYLKTEHFKDPGQQIVVGTEGYFGTLPNGLQIYVNDLPNIIIIGVGVIIEDTPQSLKEALEAGNKTYLVVNKSRFKGNPDKQGFKLIKKFPKVLRLTDSRQYLHYGPQEELFFFELVK